MLLKKISVLVSLVLVSSAAMADFMDEKWAQQACDAWNKSPVLTGQLAQMPGDMFGDGYKWIDNDAGRGYKIIKIFRDGNNCGPKKAIQLTIAKKNGKAMCVYGGKPDGKKMNFSVDYVMHATDKNWTCMGTGSCGVMGSMMTGKLKFQGPKMEAMKVMDPFAGFLKLTGQVPGAKNACK